MRRAGRIALIAALLFVACASLPERADRAAAARGYERLVLTGTDFRHVAYFKPGVGDTLHVYVEHDGIPWATLTSPSPDPTPRRLLMMELMAGDTAPALYLGRPCYFGEAARPECAPIWWTHWRFSEAVIRSMKAALRAFLGAHPGIEAIELFGYSGGGVVATLMAADVPEVRRLVTLCAPLDIDAWARLHDYSPLEGSLNPVAEPPLPPRISQLHIGGTADDVVPPSVIERFVRKQIRADYVEVAGAHHDCCWEKTWSSTVLAR